MLRYHRNHLTPKEPEPYKPTSPKLTPGPRRTNPTVDIVGSPRVWQRSTRRVANLTSCLRMASAHSAAEKNVFQSWLSRFKRGSNLPNAYALLFGSQNSFIRTRIVNIRCKPLVRMRMVTVHLYAVMCHRSQTQHAVTIAFYDTMEFLARILFEIISGFSADRESIGIPRFVIILFLHASEPIWVAAYLRVANYLLALRFWIWMCDGAGTCSLSENNTFKLSECLMYRNYT